MTVPALPPLPAELLAAHGRAHRAVADCWAEVTSVHPVARWVLRRILLESHAKLQPVRAGGDGELLLPPPRAFLAAGQVERLRAAGVAFDHVDSLLAMWGQGLRPAVLEPWTPMVLHGMLEGARPTGIDANAGLLRGGETKWLPLKNPMVHPPAGEVGELLAAAVDLAVRAPVPPIARAGWLAFTFLSIHPFLDGNGRTARMLFQAVASSEAPLGVDWGAVEQFSLRRDGYIAALQAGQTIERYDPALLDPLPFMTFGAEASIAGAGLTVARLRLLAERHRALVAEGVDPVAANVVLLAAVDGPVSVDDVASLEPTSPTQLVARLVDAGRLAWAPVPPSRRRPGQTAPPGLVAT